MTTILANFEQASLTQIKDEWSNVIQYINYKLNASKLNHKTPPYKFIARAYNTLVSVLLRHNIVVTFSWLRLLFNYLERHKEMSPDEHLETVSLMTNIAVMTKEVIVPNRWEIKIYLLNKTTESNKLNDAAIQVFDNLLELVEKRKNYEAVYRWAVQLYDELI